MRIKLNHFYMHVNSADVCVKVLRSLGSGTHEVEWYDLGMMRNVQSRHEPVQEIYMHPDVWADITEHVSAKWSS